MIDFATQTLHSEAHAPFDGAEGKLEVRRDLEVRQLTVEGERDDFALRVGQQGEHADQVARLRAVGGLIGHAV